MNSSKFSDFGLAVKTELLKSGKTQEWLLDEVAEKTGLYIDRSYMYKILTGKRKAEKVVSAVCEVLGIER